MTTIWKNFWTSSTLKRSPGRVAEIKVSGFFHRKPKNLGPNSKKFRKIGSELSRVNLHFCVHREFRSRLKSFNSISSSFDFWLFSWFFKYFESIFWSCCWSGQMVFLDFVSIDQFFALVLQQLSVFYKLGVFLHLASWLEVLHSNNW